MPFFRLHVYAEFRIKVKDGKRLPLGSSRPRSEEGERVVSFHIAAGSALSLVGMRLVLGLECKVRVGRAKEHFTVT